MSAYRTGRTTRMLADAYKKALEATESAKESKSAGLRFYGLNVYVLFLTERQADYWRTLLTQQAGGKLPSNLHLISRDAVGLAYGPSEEFVDHAVRYQACMDRGIQPWEIPWQSNWDEYTQYDLENTPLELKRPKFTDPDGTPHYPSIADVALQMRVLEGYSTGCDSEEHF